MAISTSDWIVIITATVQLVAMVSIGVLTLMAMRPKTKPADSQTSALKTSSKTWFIQQTWPFVLSAAIAVWFMWQALSSSGEVTRSFVISLVFGALLLSFSALGILGYLIAAVFRSNLNKDT